MYGISEIPLPTGDGVQPIGGVPLPQVEETPPHNYDADQRAWMLRLFEHNESSLHWVATDTSSRRPQSSMARNAHPKSKVVPQIEAGHPVGIVPGKRVGSDVRLVVIDIDLKGPDQQLAREACLKEIADRFDPGSWCAIKSGGGVGDHVYLRVNDSVMMSKTLPQTLPYSGHDKAIDLKIKVLCTITRPTAEFVEWMGRRDELPDQTDALFAWVEELKQHQRFPRCQEWQRPRTGRTRDARRRGVP